MNGLVQDARDFNTLAEFLARRDVPQMSAAAHFVRKKQPMYSPAVSFHVLRISCGTLWMVRSNGPMPYSAPQYAKFTP